MEIIKKKKDGCRRKMKRKKSRGKKWKRIKTAKCEGIE